MHSASHNWPFRAVHRRFTALWHRLPTLPQLARALPALADTLLLGVQRGKHRFIFNEIADLPVQAGDLGVYLKAEAESR